MQLRNIGTPLLILTVALGFTLWGCLHHHPLWHIRDLFQCARTYIRFPKLHPNRVNYPTNATGTSSNHTAHLVPKIIHQILLNEHHFHDGDGPNRFAKYENARNSCIALHPDWEHKLWTEDNATAWVRQHYPEKRYPFDDTPEVYQAYIKYRQTIQRTNVLRYLLLHHYGGVYLDMDITCRVNLDPLLQVPFLTPVAHPAGINNAFILARPKHPFLTKLIEQVPKHNLTWTGLPYVENMLSTGCMFVSNVWVSYMRDMAQKEQKARKEHEARIVQEARKMLKLFKLLQKFGFHKSLKLPKEEDIPRAEHMQIMKGMPREEDKVYILADEHNKTASHMLRGNVTTPLFHHGGESSWHGKDAKFIFWMDKHWMHVLIGSLLFLFFSAALLTFFLCWKRPCWLGGRCRHRDRCPYGKRKPMKGDMEYSGGGGGEAYADLSLASNVAVHTPSRPEPDAYTGEQPLASNNVRWASETHGVADSVASDATIRPSDGQTLVVAKR